MDPLSLGAMVAVLVAGAVSHMGEDAADAAANAARKLVGWLRGHFSAAGDESAGSALARVEDAPDSPSRLSELAAVIDDRAGVDAQFRAELEARVEQARAAGAQIGPVTQTAWGNQNVQSANVSGSLISVSYVQPRPVERPTE